MKNTISKIWFATLFVYLISFILVFTALFTNLGYSNLYYLILCIISVINMMRIFSIPIPPFQDSTLLSLWKKISVKDSSMDSTYEQYIPLFYCNLFIFYLAGTYSLVDSHYVLWSACLAIMSMICIFFITIACIRNIKNWRTTTIKNSNALYYVVFLLSLVILCIGIFINAWKEYDDVVSLLVFIIANACVLCSNFAITRTDRNIVRRRIME